MSRSPDPPRTSRPLPVPWQRCLIGVVAAFLAASCATAPPRSAADLGFPSPLAGPGAPPLDRSAAQLVEQGWEKLQAGQYAAARQSATRAGGGPSSRLLALQATLLENPTEAVTGLGDLTSAEPSYAAAWLTLSVAGERTGNEAVALAAARRGAELWNRSPWVDRLEQLHRRYVDQRLDDAAARLGAGEAEEALSLADGVLAVEPLNRSAVLVQARSLLALGRDAEAESALTPLGADPEALLLSGAIAERRQDWETAMDLYDSLPPDHPQRQASLRRAKLQWRLSNLAPCVRAALASPRLTRSQLAILLVALAPQLGTIGGGAPPVLSDIVDLPCSDEIVTAARLELVGSDPLEHRFYPARPARADEVRDAVDGLCHLLALKPPVWCPEPGPGCTVLSDPIGGSQLAETVLQLLETEGP